MLTIRNAQMETLAQRAKGVGTVQPCPLARTWLEIALVGEDDGPVAGERYELQLPDGSVLEGTLDHEGRVRVPDLPAGTCRVSFPALDCDAWEVVSS